MQKLLATLSVTLLVLPVAVSAATAEELAAQIQALLNQVNALQAQAGGTSAVSTATPGVAVSECPYTSRVLKKGSSGADVTRLQQFLATDPAIYPEKSVTGYYGALTEAAVKRFQCKHKLVCDGTPESTGYGVAGPRTASLLALQCSNAGGASGAAAPSGFIRVTPTSGVAPLTVKVEAVVNAAKSCSAQSYEINFGDSSQSVYANVPANSCVEHSQTFTHTYARGGSYGIYIRSGGHQNMVVVNVTGDGTSNQDDSDADGPFSVTAASDGNPLRVSAQFELPSSCARYQLDWGDGSGYSTQAQGSCSSGATNKTVSHTYANPGQYTLRLKRGSSLQSVDTVSVSISN